MFMFQQIVYGLRHNADSIFTVLPSECCSGMYVESASEQLKFKQANYFRLLYVCLCFSVYSTKSRIWVLYTRLLCFYPIYLIMARQEDAILQFLISMKLCFLVAQCFTELHPGSANVHLQHKQHVTENAGTVQ